jgi:hypothetical protein
VLVKEGLEEAGAVAEAAEHGPLADSRPLGDGVERDLLGAALGQHPARRIEDPDPIRRCVGALAPLAGERKTAWLVHPQKLS